MADKTYIGKKRFDIFGEELILVNINSNMELLEEGKFNVSEVDEEKPFSEAIKKCEDFENG